MYEEVKRSKSSTGVPFSLRRTSHTYLCKRMMYRYLERLLATENQIYARNARREAMKRDLELEGATRYFSYAIELWEGRRVVSRGDSWARNTSTGALRRRMWKIPCLGWRKMFIEDERHQWSEGGRPLSIVCGASKAEQEVYRFSTWSIPRV